MRLGSSHDAQDICQLVFLKLLEHERAGNAFANAEHEKAWVIRTTLNACTDAQRSAWHQKVGPLDEEERDLGADEPFADDESPSDQQVFEAVFTLPPAYRQAVYLYDYEGYSAQRIADLTGEAVATVNVHLSRARAKLRKLLEGDAS